MSTWIVGLDKDAEACGLDRDSLERSLLLPINAYTKIGNGGDVVARPILILDVLVLKGAAACVTSLTLRLEQYVRTELPHKKPYFATVTIYRDQHLLMNPPGNRTNVTNAVEGLGKRFALEWQKQNPN